MKQLGGICRPVVFPVVLMNTWVRTLVNHRQETSLAAKVRRKRFDLFLRLASAFPPPIHVLDIGGEQRFWEVMGLAGNPSFQFVILNIIEPEITFSNFRKITGDATNMHDIADGEFEIAFSNSVIEHLGTYARQDKMAQEIRRVGQSYFIQTPNKHFPIEPHFLVPFFQYFPMGLKISMVQRLNLGWYQKIPDQEKAREHILSHRLLTESEMRTLFPNGKLFKERILGLTKSFIAYGGRLDITGI